MRRGDTVFLPAGPQGWPHLWIVATEPDEQTGHAVLVSLTTLRNQMDQTVILRPRDHPFVRHESSVFYGDARMLDTIQIEHDIERGLLKAGEPCAITIADEIETGLRVSPMTPKKILHFLGLAG